MTTLTLSVGGKDFKFKKLKNAAELIRFLTALGGIQSATDSYRVLSADLDEILADKSAPPQKRLDAYSAKVQLDQSYAERMGKTLADAFAHLLEHCLSDGISALSIDEAVQLLNEFVSAHLPSKEEEGN